MKKRYVHICSEFILCSVQDCCWKNTFFWQKPKWMKYVNRNIYEDPFWPPAIYCNPDGSGWSSYSHNSKHKIKLISTNIQVEDTIDNEAEIGRYKNSKD